MNDGWNPRLVDQLCTRLCNTAGLPTPFRRTRIRVWKLSGVERVHLRDATSVILKYARGPFITEDRALTLAAARGVPVPTVLATTTQAGALGMILNDLGGPLRRAEPVDAAAAAAQLHHDGPAAGLSNLDEAGLRSLPMRAQSYVERLRADRSPTTTAIRSALNHLEAVADRRSVGAERPPYGMCHGELHASALHIGHDRTRLLDLAMAHNGPGLLDLASWFGTRQTPDPAALRVLINLYVRAGGHPDAQADRGGLPATIWALAWHRVWAAVWHLRQAHRSDDETQDLSVARRQLAAAATLMPH